MGIISWAGGKGKGRMANRARLESGAHQGEFISLLLRALRAFRLWRLYRLYRNSDATVMQQCRLSAIPIPTPQSVQSVPQIR